MKEILFVRYGKTLYMIKRVFLSILIRFDLEMNFQQLALFSQEYQVMTN